MVKKILVFFVSFVAFNCECVSQSNSDCFNAYHKNLKSTETYRSVLQLANDTVTSWIGKELVGVYELDSIFKWKFSEYVLFNKERTKGLLFLGLIGDSTVNYNAVHILGFEKNEAAWNIYYQTYPRISLPKENLADAEVYKNMFQTILNNMMEENYFSDKCIVNDNFFIGQFEFADWRREQHKKFLSNTW